MGGSGTTGTNASETSVLDPWNGALATQDGVTENPVFQLQSRAWCRLLLHTRHHASPGPFGSPGSQGLTSPFIPLSAPFPLRVLMGTEKEEINNYVSAIGLGVVDHSDSIVVTYSSCYPTPSSQSRCTFPSHH